MKDNTRLLEIIGSPSFTEPLNDKKNPDYQAMVKMGYYQPTYRDYIFKHENGGIDIVTKEEKLIWCHNHFRLSYRITAKSILHPTHPATKQGKAIKVMTFNELQSLYNRMHMTDTPFRQYVEQVYPQLVAWLRAPFSVAVAPVSVEYLLRNKIYSEEKFAKRKFKALWYSSYKLLVAANKSAKEIAYHNEIARKYPELNNWLHQTMVLDEEGKIVYVGAYPWTIRHDAMKLAQAYNVPFKFTWSDKRVQDLHDKLQCVYTKMVAQRDNKPLAIGNNFTIHDWTQDNNEEFQVRVLTTTGELAEEGLTLDHCVATYANSVNQGNTLILSTLYNGVGYTAEIGYNYNWSGPNTYEIRQYRGHKNQDAPRAAYDHLRALVNKFNPQEVQIGERENPYSVEIIEAGLRDLVPVEDLRVLID